jgi:hypothetical protein
MVGPLSLAICVYIITFFAAQMGGVFRESPAGLWETLFSLPVALALFLFILLRVYGMFRMGKSTLKRRFLTEAGIVLIVSGLVAGFFVHYSSEVVITEGEIYRVTEGSPLERVLYKGLKARRGPWIFKLLKLHPRFSSDARGIRGIDGEFLFREGTEREKNVKISTRLPFVTKDGLILWIRDFGYSFRYVFRYRGMEGGAFIALRVFPPGNEDYFRLMASPHTYYVRYYPALDKRGKKPLRLRIARNKDLIYDSYIDLDEDVEFEGASISFPEVRKWTVLSVSYAPWIYPVIGGLVLMIAGVLINLVKRGQKK